MAKRYRTRPYQPGTLKAYWGIAERGDKPCLVANGRKADCALLLDAFETGPAKLDHLAGTFSGFAASFLEELASRGYDLTTIEFSIQKKAAPSADSEAASDG